MAAEEETAPPMAPAELGAPAGRAGAPATSAPQLPPLLGGKYRPVRLIAKGGMGAVYEVVHTNTGQHLALKLMLARSLLAPELVDRFRREARIHTSMKSEHIVRVIDADVAHELDDVPFLVMELLEGSDLERVCLERRPSKIEVVSWMRQLAAALDKAHEGKIVHRDLKPENLFLAEREGLPPVIKILDFGVAKFASEADGQATATGQILGTPRYMAPEQAVDAKQISAAADRFALGLIAFRLLCGRHYFAGDNWIGLLREVGRGPRQPPSALGSNHGAAFDAWFAHACALDPRRRFATCAEQVEALAQALEGTATAGGRRWRARAWGVVAVAAASAAAVWGLDHRRAAPVQPPLVIGGASPAGAAPAPARGVTDVAALPSLNGLRQGPTVPARDHVAPRVDPTPDPIAKPAHRTATAAPSRRRDGAGPPRPTAAKNDAEAHAKRATDPVWDEP